MAVYVALLSDQERLRKLDGQMLAEAFPLKYSLAASSAGSAVVRILESRQLGRSFSVNSEGQRVLIPSRLYFASQRLPLSDCDEAWIFARALQTRSNDGFERQRAARDVLADLQPWAAPFIVALIGQYIIEILDDSSAALTIENTQTLAAFIVQNEGYWNTTKRRVVSYWAAYYRSDLTCETHRVYRRDAYVGFKIVDQLETAVFGRT